MIEFEKIPETYIQDKELALDMAYGELAQYEYAVECANNGLILESFHYLANVNQVGILAGLNYIANIQDLDEGEYGKVRFNQSQLSSGIGVVSSQVAGKLDELREKLS